MRSARVVALSLLLTPFAFSQTQDSNPAGVSASANAASTAGQAQQAPS
jgi:hypothetical protein